MARGLLGRNSNLHIRQRRRDALKEADLVILAGKNDYYHYNNSIFKWKNLCSQNLWHWKRGYYPTTVMPMKMSLKNRLRDLWNFLALMPSNTVAWSWEVRLELKREDRIWVQREMVEFVVLPFPFSSQLKIWSFHIRVVQWWQRNVQISVMHAQSCCFSHKTCCVLDIPIAVAVVIS